MRRFWELPKFLVQDTTLLFLVHEMVDSSHLINKIDLLREVISRDGYLLLRGFLDRETVLNARKTILAFAGDTIDTKKGSMMEGYATDPSQSLGLLNYQFLTREPTVKKSFRK